MFRRGHQIDTLSGEVDRQRDNVHKSTTEAHDSASEKAMIQLSICNAFKEMIFWKPT